MRRIKTENNETFAHVLGKGTIEINGRTRDLSSLATTSRLSALSQPRQEKWL